MLINETKRIIDIFEKINKTTKQELLSEIEIDYGWEYRCHLKTSQPKIQKAIKQYKADNKTAAQTLESIQAPLDDIIQSLRVFEQLLDIIQERYTDHLEMLVLEKLHKK